MRLGCRCHELTKDAIDQGFLRIDLWFTTMPTLDPTTASILRRRRGVAVVVVVE